MTTFEIRIKSKLTEIEEVQQHFKVFSKHHDISDRTVQKMSIVIDELLNNIITYAYDGDGDEHDIKVKADISENHGKLYVTIADDGIPFNPLEHEPPDLTTPIEKRTIGGLGVLLAKELSDQLTYERDVDGNVVTFIMTVD